MNEMYFHFKLGPVQSFVAQARRTRDYWAGSFLLSWLSAVAMVLVERRGGKIIVPLPQRDFLDAVAGKSRGEGPRFGSIPNRFIAKVGGDFEPEGLLRDLAQAWEQLAEHVWRQDLDGSPDATRAIWERQTRFAAFWQPAWCLTDEEKADHLLDRRGGWRAHTAPDEPGVKCTVMDGWQELSGAERPGRAVKTFWSRQRWGHDVREDECLCALAFIKRRFARHFDKFSASLSDDLTIRGWQVPVNVPSLAYMATAPWLAHVIMHPKNSVPTLETLADAADKLEDRGEITSRIRCLVDAARQKFNRDTHPLMQVDAKVFHANELDNENQYPDAAKVRAMKAALGAIAADQPLSPFCALLLLDGDSLGALLRTADRDGVSQALQIFTERVPRIVDKHSGFLIYAGGDDVLALLPLDDALACAVELRGSYQQAFRDANLSGTQTISAAITYMHMHTPLTQVVRDTHALLDDVAKDVCGRDSLAVRVWKTSGVTVQWAQPWEIALDDGGKAWLERLALRLRDTESDVIGFSSKFLYRIRERLEMLQPKHTGAAPEYMFDQQQAVKIMAAEYLQSLTGRGAKMALTEAENLVEPLLEQCRLRMRGFDDSGRLLPRESWPLRDPMRPYSSDGALLARFLATRGKER